MTSDKVSVQDAYQQEKWARAEAFRNLPSGTILRFKKSDPYMAAESGALATISDNKIVYNQYYINIRWIRNGLDRGQCDGDYLPGHFEVVTTSASITCNCSWNQILQSGCRYQKGKDPQGFQHN